MNRQKTASKSHGSVIKIFLCILAGGIAVVLLTFFKLCFATPWYRTKISNREEMFQFVHGNQDELRQVVDEMINLFETNDEKVIILDKNNKNEWEQLELQNVDNFYNNFLVNYIAADTLHGAMRVSISFALTPKEYDYWGIYYTEDGEPDDWGGEAELVEQGGTYVQIGSFYRYETEKIVDNWYYYQCDTR